MKRRYILLTLVMVLPALAGLIALSASSDAVANIDRVPAAIVNLDTPATLESGQTLPAGRQLVGNLQADPSGDTGRTLDWTVLSEETAAKGLADGTYYAVVTIPAEFSQSVADVLQGKSTDVPHVTVEAAPSSPIMEDVTQQIVNSAAEELGTTLTVSYLSTSLGATGQISDAIGTAADGAHQLADGQVQAADGASALAGGTDTLLGGLTQLSDGTSALVTGAGKLSSGVRSYTDGVNAAASGVGTLAAGAHTVADGVGAYTDGVQQVYQGMTVPQAGSPVSLVDGAHAVAAGTDVLNSQLQGLDVSGLAGMPAQLQSAADGAHAISGAIVTGQSSSGVPSLVDLITACQASGGDPQACGTAKAVAQGVAGKAQELGDGLQQGANGAAAAAGQLAALEQGKAQVAQLASGAQGVATGLDQVTGGMRSNLIGAPATALADGAAQVASGADTLASGMGTLQGSSAALNSGAAGLATGAGQVNAGVGEAADGASALNEGAGTLADGTSQLTDGAEKLASGLGEAADAVPVYAEDEVSDMASAIAAPVGVAEAGAPAVSARTAFAGGAAAVTLWLGTLMAVLALGSLNRHRIGEAATPLRLTVVALWPAVLVALIQGILMVAVLTIAGVDLAHPWGVIGLMALAAVALAVTQQAFVAAFGRRGGALLSLSLILVQAACLGVALPGATRTGLAAFIAGVTPVPQAAGALQTLIVGEHAPVGGAIAVLVVWAVVAFVVTVAAIKKRRQTSVGALRAELAA